jgi:hypothetical protein
MFKTTSVVNFRGAGVLKIPEGELTHPSSRVVPTAGDDKNMKSTFEILRGPEVDMYFDCTPGERESDAEFEQRKESLRGLFSTIWTITDLTGEFPEETSIRSPLYVEDKKVFAIERALEAVGRVIAERLINK